MNFNHVDKRKLYGFSIRELSPREMQGVSEHLSVCSQCQNALQQCKVFENHVKDYFSAPYKTEYLSSQNRISINMEVNADMKEDTENQTGWEKRTRKGFMTQLIAIVLIAGILTVLFVIALRMAENTNASPDTAVAGEKEEPEAVIQQLPVMPTKPDEEQVTGRVAIPVKMLEKKYEPAAWKTKINSTLIKRLCLDQVNAVPSQEERIIQLVRSPFISDIYMIYTYIPDAGDVKGFDLAETITNSVKWPVQAVQCKSVCFEMPGELLERIAVVKMDSGVDTLLVMDQAVDYEKACSGAKLQMLMYSLATPNLFFRKDVKEKASQDLEKIAADPALKNRQSIEIVISKLKGMHGK